MVDADVDAARSLAGMLRQRGYEVLLAPDGEAAINALAHARIDGVVCPLRSPRIDGFAVLAALRSHRPDGCAIMVSDGPELERAVEAMRRGASDVQMRPVHAGRLLAALERGLEHLALAERVHEMEGERDRRAGRVSPAGSSRAMQRVREQIVQVGPMRTAVLIEGEEGVGKATVARAIHLDSPRARGPFLRFDCSGLPAEMVEAELWGVEAADADASLSGRVEAADGGTLVLDAVDLLTAHAQVLLLRLLQDRTFERVGGTRSLRADVRVVATTAQDLEAAAREGRFREDLFGQLAVVRIALPPLRDRREDIPALVEQLLRELATEHGRRPRRVTRGLMDRLVEQPWPGNVAELKHVLEGLMLTAQGRGPLDVTALPSAFAVGAGARPTLGIRTGMTLDETERALIEATLRDAGGDKPRVAALLGIGLRTLYRKLELYRRG